MYGNDPDFSGGKVPEGGEYARRTSSGSVGCLRIPGISEDGARVSARVGNPFSYLRRLCLRSRVWPLRTGFV